MYTSLHEHVFLFIQFHNPQNATREPFKTLGDSLRRDPRLVIKDYPERLAERLIEYNGVFAQVD